MKAFPITKVLTGVTILFFTCLSMGAEQNRSQCNAKCGDEVKFSCTKPAAGAENDATNKYNQCLRDAKQACIDRDGCTELDSSRDIKQACEQAFEKYSDLSAKEKEACSAFDKTAGTNCKTRAEACNKKISSLSNPYQTVKNEDGDTESKTNGYGALTEIAQVWATVENAKNPNQGGTNTSISSGGGACVKSIDRKARKDDKEKKERDRKDLLDKITKQKEAILDLQKDLNEERDKNTKEVNEITAENKKDVNAKDKELNERNSAMAKQLADINTGLRTRSLAITKKMQELAQANFTYQSSMVELSDSAIKTECENAFNNLKAAIVAKGDLPGSSAEEKARVSALVAQSKGMRGSGNLKRFLVTTRQKCYDTANMKRNAMKLKNSQDVKNIQDAIEEEKNRMKDDKDSIARAQKDLETGKTQVAKEKQDAETEMGTKLEALSKKLANQITNTENKTSVANQKIQELTAEINKLALVENFEVEDAYSEATEAIDKGRAGRDRAFEACDCTNKGTKGLDSYCSRLNDDKKAYDGTKVKKGTTKTSN